MSEAGLGGALIPVGEADLDKWRRFADGLIQNADWTPRNTAPNPGAHSAASRLRTQSLGRREGAKTSSRTPCRR